jgi:hypothetical protein
LGTFFHRPRFLVGAETYDAPRVFSATWGGAARLAASPVELLGGGVLAAARF